MKRLNQREVDPRTVNETVRKVQEIARTSLGNTEVWRPGASAASVTFTSTQAQLGGTSTVPATSDGASLGTTSLMWSDVFLASGAVLNFNNGDVTVTHSANDLAVAGGTLTLGTALAIGSGGTGATTAAGAATALGLGTGDSPQFTAVNIGHASDTTVARTSAGVINVEGKDVYMVGGTDVAVADGGTGASTAAAAVGGLISALAADTTPDRTADYLASYDASATTGKKVLMQTFCPWRTVFKTADETLTTNTTFQDDDALTFAVAANTKYAFRAVIHYNTPTAADFKFQFTGPAAPTLVRIEGFEDGGGGVDANNQSVVNTAFSTSNAQLYASPTDIMLQVQGILQNGANAGNVTLQWAQNSSSGTTTVYAGSYLEWAVVA